MKMNASPLRHLASVAAISAMMLVEASAQTTTATTVPVGFMTVSVPAAASGTSPSNAVMAIPLYNTADFAGPVASVDDDTHFTLTGASFGTGGNGLTPVISTANPRLVRVKTSATASHVGQYFVVVGSGTNGSQLQVTNPYGGSPTLTNGNSVSVGDTCEVLPANTLANLFGPNSAGATSVFASGSFFLTGTTASAADNVLLWNGTTWVIYYNNNTNWKASGSLSNQNNTVIYPDEGLFIIHRDTVNALNLTLSGTAPSTAEYTNLAGAGSTFIPNRFPTDTTLLASGIQNTPGWKTGASASAADNVFIWTGTTWAIYYFNGTNWKKSGSLSIQDSTPITAGTSVFITKANAGTALIQALPYSLN